jgi:hypothetical protein
MANITVVLFAKHEPFALPPREASSPNGQIMALLFVVFAALMLLTSGWFWLHKRKKTYAVSEK